MRFYSSLSSHLKTGTPWIWLTSAAVTIITLAALALIAMIAVKGLNYFWPQPVVYVQSTDNQDLQPSSLGVLIEQQRGDTAMASRLLVRSTSAVTLKPSYRWIDVSPAQPMFPTNGIVIQHRDGHYIYGLWLSSTIVLKDNFYDVSELLSSHRKNASTSLSKVHSPTISIRTADGQVIAIALADIIEFHRPNAMTNLEKLRFFGDKLGRFVHYDQSKEYQQRNIFPAIFGTVFLVFLMTVLVAPLGVIAAVYLHEYAQRGIITKVIRIAVVNLAGVPAIVYGVFGLGFFVYFIGSGIDQTFYSQDLPSPTFGEPGVLWSALTMALLTLPVVIVATEEGLSRIPKHTKLGCMALGATRLETLQHVLIPIASPAIVTGLILAIARAAGEVAPLMLVGVVKSAPSLPVDSVFPYVHLDRQFMHLGYEIFDTGVQSPSIDSSQPLVYATASLLIVVIVCLNITAVTIRNHLTQKYKDLLN